MDIFAQFVNQPKKNEQSGKNEQSLPRKKQDSSNQNSFNQEDVGKILRNILDNANQDSQNLDPEMTRVKNNLLLLLLLLTAYGIYYLIGDFLDVLLIAYIAGIAFLQSRQSFTFHLTNPEAEKIPKSSFFVRFIKAIAFTFVGLVFPRCRYMLKHPELITSMPTFHDYFISLKKTDSALVIACEIFIGLYIIHLLIGPYLKKIFLKIHPTNQQCVRVFFVIIVILSMIALIIIIPTIFFQQMSSVGKIIENKVEQKLGCSILTNGYQDQTLPLCSQMISNQNQFIQQTVQQFQEQNKTLEECLIFLQKTQEQYIGEYIKRYKILDDNIYYYDEILCTWYSFLDKIVSYSGIKINGKEDLHQVFSTGSSLFKLFFGNLAWILSKISNSVFNITTFITAFLLTARSRNSSSSVFKVFSQNKKQLIYSITNLIQATFFIVLQHFFFSYLLLEIFAISPINLMISTLLASMAMFPFFRPWLGILVIISIRILIVGEYYISIVFVILYYLMSEKIYSTHYRKMEMHEIITNMSVLFGIYRFGVAGVIYGPLIVITYQFVYRELFKIYVKKRQNPT